MSKTLKIALIVIFAGFFMSLPLFLNNYVLQVVMTTMTYAMLGLVFAMGLKVGLLRFDVAAYWAVGAYSVALLMTRAHWNFWPAMLAACVISMAVGLLVCLISIPRGMMVFFLVGMVLTMVFYQVFGSLTFFGSWGGVSSIPNASIGSFEFIHKPELFYMGLAFMAIILLCSYLLYNSKIGTAWNAIGSSIKLANSVGIDVVKYRIANILIGNLFLAIVGGFSVAYSHVCAPSTFSFNNSVFVMMYVIVGGINHSLVGPLIGAFIITFVPEYMRAAKEYEPIIRSVFIILVIIFLPNGLLGLIDKYVSHWFKTNKFMAPFREKEPEENVPAGKVPA